MDRLDAMRAFVRVVELGSFSRAARELRVGQPTVSKWVAALEATHGSALLVRSTRSQRLTDAGGLFYERAKEILAAYEELSAELAESDPEPAGRIRVSVPVVFGSLYVVPEVDRYLRQHPAVELELVFDDRYVRLIEEGFDLAIRVGLPKPSSLRARSLGGTARVLVASPSYLRGRPPIASPADLSEHDCLLHTGLEAGARWTFEGKGPQSVRVRGRFSANHSASLAAMARAGHGVALLAEWLVHEDLREGRLLALLPGYRLPPAPIQALTPPGRRLHPRVRHFLRFLAERFAARFGPDREEDPFVG